MATIAGVADDSFNEMHELAALYQALTTAPQSGSAAAAQAVQDYLVKQAWFALVGFSPVFYYASPDLGGVHVTANSPLPDPVDWYPTK